VDDVTVGTTQDAASPPTAAAPTPFDTTVSTVMAPPVVVTAGLPIEAAAAAMTRAGSSAAIVVAGGRAVGIVTDADIRARHVAAASGPDRPVEQLATSDPLVIAPHQPLAEALSLMASRGVHHLPVVDAGEPVGMVDAGLLLAAVAGDPLRVLGTASTAGDTGELQAAYLRLPVVVERLVGTGSGGLAVTRLLSLFTEQAMIRAVGWACDELGPPPAAFAIVALGSLARREQTLVTDQDHALVISDGAGSEPWFAALGQRVTDVLAAVGFLRCPGEVMISNPVWRDEAASWRRRWEAFLAEPSPEHILASNIVLDARPVVGDPALAVPFLTVARRARGSGNFLLFLANSARELHPPIGALGRWRLERRGPHAGSFDIKRGLIVPIVQIARVHALAVASEAMETVQRLNDAADGGQISRDAADILANGYELATTVRLVDQAARARSGQELDNWVRPAQLTAWQRVGLKEVARTIRTAQESISLSYQGAYVG
jgi:CBS domain-containing protein